MASVALRRLILDPGLDPQVARMGVVLNRVVDMVNGNQAGRLWLLHDDGNKKAISSSVGVNAGTVLSANNYPLRVEPTSTNQVNVLHSNGATIGLRVQDGGLTTGVPASLTSTLAVTGAATFNGAVTLGDAAADAITVTGTATFTPLATFTGGLTSVGPGTFNGAVTLGDAAADVISVLGTATFAEIVTMAKGLVVDTTTLVVDAVNNKVGVGAVPVSTDAMLTVAGALRSTAQTGLATSGTGTEVNYDVASSTGSLVCIDRATTTFKNLDIYGLAIKLRPGGTTRIEADGTGLGFFNTSPVAQPAAGAAAGGTLAQVTTLANDLRTGLRDLGLFS